ncbi:AAA family ATPase [Fluviicola sp.]|uniref:AAA family ATPase n=1 Tax=Fluviicola sp. TaxID=1917219 RepID=UPI00261652B2|nr:AAA family ATPase [Fluviicola sp.]
MKIALTGAHKVGKTTLAEKLQESLPDYIFVQEPYVELEEKGIVFSETPELEDFSAQLEHSIERMDLDEPDVIFDRSPLDLLAYVYATGGAKASQNFYTKVREATEEIDLLIFVPVENPDIIGCPESEFPQLREKVNDLLEEWINDFDLETLVVRGTLAARERQVLETIVRLY